MFGQETLYANPISEWGFKSFMIFDSYLNIVFTSFLGVFIIKILSLFIDPFEFVSQFRSINEDIELLINNSVEISDLFIVSILLFLIVRAYLNKSASIIKTFKKLNIFIIMNKKKIIFRFVIFLKTFDYFYQNNKYELFSA